jgi:hypothetical protein
MPLLQRASGDPTQTKADFVKQTYRPTRPSIHPIGSVSSTLSAARQAADYPLSARSRSKALRPALNEPGYIPSAFKEKHSIPTPRYPHRLQALDMKPRPPELPPSSRLSCQLIDQQAGTSPAGCRKSKSGNADDHEVEAHPSAQELITLIRQDLAKLHPGTALGSVVRNTTETVDQPLPDEKVARAVHKLGDAQRGEPSLALPARLERSDELRKRRRELHAAAAEARMAKGSDE